MHNFKDLNVWMKARQLVKEVYLITANFPKEEKFGLTSQIRRSAVSIPSNIAEGCGRRTQKDFCKFLYIAQASTFEFETQLMLSLDLGFVDNQTFGQNLNQLNEIQKTLNGLINSIENKLNK
ncbi:four helix bundle protein [Marivirga sp.]|uniref:four helix bundle protein n=1 Tax=Marivirga sp. TaxID=2018662 RepID=UPI002D80C3F5|nr:four helix bundle protein [Marivirga sp.]HET8860406.1 four helix bundle protein [Marivirga sp.]